MITIEKVSQLNLQKKDDNSEESTMSTGKYISLEEARKNGQLDRFIQEHPSKADGHLFRQLLDAMTTKQPAKSETSTPESSGSCNETQTP